MQGVIDGDDVPGGCHVASVAVAIDGFPALSAGQPVEFEWVPRDEQFESGFEYECTRAWPAGKQPHQAPPFTGAKAWTVYPNGTTEEITDADLPEDVAVPRGETGRATGTVQTWNDEEGWGVIHSAQTPGGCWAYYTEIVGKGFRKLTVGATVTFDWEQVTDQDGYRYRALRVNQRSG